MITGIEFIIGAILPPFIDLINKHIKDEKYRYLISVVVCVGLAVGMNYAEMLPENVIKTLGVIFVSSQTIYKLYWKQSNLRASLTK